MTDTTPVPAAQNRPTTNAVSTPSSSTLTVEFVQKLALGQRSSYSDFLTPPALDSIHIRTPLDDFVKSLLDKGQSVILTGNAGDGKTHLLRRLKKDLKKVHLIEDASVPALEEIAAEWQTAIDTGMPFCMAANEWRLYQLISQYAEKMPILHKVEQQVKRSLVY